MNFYKMFRTVPAVDDPAVLDLMEASFNKKFTKEWWDWYNQNPNGANRYSVIADVDSEDYFYGGYGLLPIKLWLNGEVWNGSLCQNVCTHPKQQGKGLFTILGEYALKQEEFYSTRVSLGMPNTKAVKGHLKVGWDELVPLSFYSKQPGRYFFSTKLLEHHHFTPDVNPFLQTIEKGYALTLSKDCNWLNWRFTSRLGYNNQIFISRKGSEVTGYCVAKLYQDKAHILDIQAADERSFKRLVVAAETYANGQREINVWTNPRAPYRKWFEELYYTEQPSDDRLIIHTNYGEKVTVQPGLINFTLSDNDVY